MMLPWKSNGDDGDGDSDGDVDGDGDGDGDGDDGREKDYCSWWLFPQLLSPGLVGFNNPAFVATEPDQDFPVKKSQ